MKFWFSCVVGVQHPTTNIQIVICCKIFGPHCNGSKAMVFVLFERWNMVHFGNYVTPTTRVVSFGTVPLHNLVTRRLLDWGVSSTTFSRMFSMHRTRSTIVCDQYSCSCSVSSECRSHSSCSSRWF
jgi:hypothetical protein